MIRKKVHIVPVGFELDTAVKPVQYIGADKVYLTNRKDCVYEVEKKFSDLFEQELSARMKKLNPSLEVITQRVDMFDFNQVLALFSRIIIKEVKEGNLVYMNVSSSTTLQSIAGLLSVLMYGSPNGEPQAYAYYVKPTGFNPEPVDKRGEVVGLTQVDGIREGDTLIFLPDYSLSAPKTELIRVLSLLDDSPTDQLRLKKALVERGMVKTDLKGEKVGRSKRLHSWYLRNVLMPLLDNGFVKKVGKGKHSELHLTPKGKSTKLTFEGLLDVLE